MFPNLLPNGVEIWLRSRDWRHIRFINILSASRGSGLCFNTSDHDADISGGYKFVSLQLPVLSDVLSMLLVHVHMPGRMLCEAVPKERQTLLP